ncbi:KTSC domain-containing protein [Pusillimonas sp. ANT_WB101]|uniref:KTSC domain-containing protein n=1 Tax=Pusillimonas sp. ANT_WB101 TaxID=2597356 RepID=UPI0011EDDEC3|nr:KTSC domain-containing protein [Pusillimonas sp. ANT_WB101]KAA0910646.1 KTSC domain-containing protein [Pusillimonas sp. ANT_WB101]
MDTSITTRPIIATDSVESSQVAAIGHDPQTNTLAIRFPANRKGVCSVYHYANFTAEQFEAFKAAESKGSYFGKNIKRCADQFPYENVTALYGSEAATEQPTVDAQAIE